LMAAARFAHKGLKTSPVVIDFGEAYIKCGFAGEGTPRHVFANDFEKKGIDSSKPVSLRGWLTFLSKAMNTIYFQRLLTNPKERPVVICENIYWPYTFKEALVKVLFQLGVPSLLFLPSVGSCIYATGLDSALIIDIGYNETRVLPICDGFPLDSAFTICPVGMVDIHNHFRSELKAETLSSFEVEIAQLLTPQILDRLIMQTCAVRSFSASRAEEKKETKEKPVQPVEPVSFSLGCSDGGEERKVTVGAKLRVDACDALFGMNEEGYSLAELVCQCLIKCSADVRGRVAQNLVLSGGAAHLEGFKSRLLHEIDHEMEKPSSSSLLGVKGKVGLAEIPFPSLTLAWLGGSIVGGSGVREIEEHMYTREQYESGQPIPDWTIQHLLPSKDGSSSSQAQPQSQRRIRAGSRIGGRISISSSPATPLVQTSGSSKPLPLALSTPTPGSSDSIAPTP